MRRINFTQKLIVGIGATAVGLRLFFPATREAPYGQALDVPTTVLQLVGMLVIFTAAFYLVSIADLRITRRFLFGGLVVFAWPVFLTTLAIEVRRIGLATSLRTIQWFLTGWALAAFVLLAWMTRLAFFRQDALPSARMARSSFVVLSLIALLLTGGYFGELYQSRSEAARQISFSKELERLRYGIVEGERIGPVQLGMSLEEVNRSIGRRFSSGERLSNGLTSYIWRPLGSGNDFWNVFFDSKTSKAVIIGYGFSIVPSRSPAPPKGFVLEPPAQREIESSRFQTVRGVRFGDSPATVEALYGKPALATRLKDRKDVVTLRFHYVSIRTEFQFDESGYGLLSILVYAPGFSPQTTLRAR